MTGFKLFSKSKQIKLHNGYRLSQSDDLKIPFASNSRFSLYCIHYEGFPNEFTRQASGQGSSEYIDRIGHEEGSTESIDSEDDDIKSFYTSLGANSQSASNSVITNVQSKKTRPGQFNIDKALDMVKNVLATDFSSACHPGCSISLNSALELLCYTDENDGISVKMKDLVLQISKDFTVLKIRLYQTSNTIQRCTNLIKPMAEIASQLDENKQKFLKLDSVEATIQRSII